MTTSTTPRPLAFLLAAVIMVGLWLPTVSSPAHAGVSGGAAEAIPVSRATPVIM